MWCLGHDRCKYLSHHESKGLIFLVRGSVGHIHGLGFYYTQSSLESQGARCTRYGVKTQTTIKNHISLTWPHAQRKPGGTDPPVHLQLGLEGHSADGARCRRVDPFVDGPHVDVDAVLVGKLLAALVAIVVERRPRLLLADTSRTEVDLPVGVELVLVHRLEIALLALVRHVASVKSTIRKRKANLNLQASPLNMYTQARFQAMREVILVLFVLAMSPRALEIHKLAPSTVASTVVPEWEIKTIKGDIVCTYTYYNPRPATYL